MAPGVASGVAATGACIAAAGLAAGAFAYASSWPTSQLFGRTLIAGHDPAEVALTYDDGPNPAATPQLLEVLARSRTPATFFLIGDFARRHPELVRAIAAAGHSIGNHTMTHPKLAVQRESRIREELSGCSRLLEDLLGERVELFRPPYGSRRPAVLRIAAELGLSPVLWNVTGYDWNPIGEDRILANLERGIARNRRRRRGSNLLLHDGGHLGLNAPRLDTVAATKRLIAASGEGVRFVPVGASL
jgi:peptidoglycan/xylan/chitin deacetylase (PgdA/CDA1 family)